MKTTIDGMIETTTELRKLIRTYQGLLQRFERGAINGWYLARPAYAHEFRKMAKEAREIEEMCLEAARYFGHEIARANKTPGRLKLSIHQQNQLVSFLEMTKKPLFPALTGAEYRQPSMSTNSMRPDC